MAAVPALAQQDAGNPSSGTDPASVLPPQLRALRSYMETQPEMDFQTTFRASSSVLDTKSQGTADFLTKLPNLLRVSFKSSGNTYQYVSDGTLLTIYNARSNDYADTAARASVIGNMTFIAGLMSFQSRIFDFLAALDQAVLGGGVKITAAGSESVNGRQCDRFAVVTQVEKWDVWVEKAAPNLPCKLVSSDVNGPAGTVQVNEFTWKKAPKIDAATFKFSAPAGSKRVDVGTLLAGPD
ncbi:DUF2092 domain-containing protein [Hyphomicrobium sp.]|uniref:DUF2092 domain-containing protein n=1 Tax=Hyphomicrobium sp. TaxID=82 RepID=UPI002D7859B8|nr:DUF2092 domain-containing protein [Hyphomicrobium sp.]HET6389224.1 DUF2092 domain-containing protein [Hyphomicrobium sp.]